MLQLKFGEKIFSGAGLKLIAAVTWLIQDKDARSLQLTDAVFYHGVVWNLESSGNSLDLSMSRRVLMKRNQTSTTRTLLCGEKAWYRIRGSASWQAKAKNSDWHLRALLILMFILREWMMPLTALHTVFVSMKCCNCWWHGALWSAWELLHGSEPMKCLIFKSLSFLAIASSQGHFLNFEYGFMQSWYALKYFLVEEVQF
jgi:hypothetical protein